MGRARGAWRVTLSLLGIGLLTVAVADSSFVWLTAHGAYATGNLLDAGYFSGYLLIGLAALRAPATSRLRRYPIDSLQIDRSFLADYPHAGDRADVLITSIVALGRGLGLEVVAEGVETAEQLDALRSIGCPEAQGFLFARPADPEIVLDLVRAGVALAEPRVG